MHHIVVLSVYSKALYFYISLHETDINLRHVSTVNMISNKMAREAHSSYHGCTVSLINSYACYSARSLIKLWLNNSSAQSESETASNHLVKLSMLLLRIILIQLIMEQTTDSLTLVLTCACVSADSPHTYTCTSNKCRGLPNISVCVFLICPPTEEEEEALSHHHRFFSINVTPASKIYSNLVPSPLIPEQLPCSGHLHPPSHCTPAACHWDTAVRERELSWLYDRKRG